MEILHLWLIFGRFQNAIAQLKLKWRPNPKSNIISVMTSLGAPKISNREEKKSTLLRFDFQTLCNFYFTCRSFLSNLNVGKKVNVLSTLACQIFPSTMHIPNYVVALQMTACSTFYQFCISLNRTRSMLDSFDYVFLQCKGKLCCYGDR